jgi:shikimate dehydrogenase
MPLFGLVGYPLEHSFSPRYFQAKFEREGISNSHYRLFPLKSIENLQREVLAPHPQLVGFNVTIPYKASIIPLLHFIDPGAKCVGAVNTVKIVNHNQEQCLYGYNTDVVGFEKLLNSIREDRDKKAMVFGTGGSAKAVTYVLNQNGITFQQVSRNKNEHHLCYEDLTEEIIGESDLLINCTPVGMWPNTEQRLPIPFGGLRKEQGLIDLIYNPVQTRFLNEGLRRGCRIANGGLMLEEQAEAAWKIWNSSTKREE